MDKTSIGRSFLAWLAAALGLISFGSLLMPGARGSTEDANTNPSLGTISKGNIVVISGDWIYDSGHAGWNEIHAVHACQIIPGPDGKTPATLNSDGTWPSDIGGGMGLDAVHLPDAISRWCSMLSDAGTVEAGGSRNDPANNWVIHPVIDGCQKVVIV